MMLASFVLLACSWAAVAVAFPQGRTIAGAAFIVCGALLPLRRFGRVRLLAQTGVWSAGLGVMVYLGAGAMPTTMERILAITGAVAFFVCATHLPAATAPPTRPIGRLTTLAVAASLVSVAAWWPHWKTAGSAVAPFDPLTLAGTTIRIIASLAAVLVVGCLLALLRWRRAQPPLDPSVLASGPRNPRLFDYEPEPVSLAVVLFAFAEFVLGPFLRLRHLGLLFAGSRRLGQYQQSRAAVALRNPARLRIYRLVQSRPGIQPYHIWKEVGGAFGVTLRALYVIEKLGLVKVVRGGRAKHYFENSPEYSDDKARVLAAISNRRIKAVLDALQGRGPISQAEISKRLGVSVATVSKRLAKMRGAGLVDVVRANGVNLYEARYMVLQPSPGPGVSPNSRTGPVSLQRVPGATSTTQEVANG